MGDALQDLARVEGLSPTDSILARTLLRHGMVDPSSVLDAARGAAQDPSGGGILERLSSSGVLSDERAQKIEAAFQKRIAERRGASAGKGPDARGALAEEAEPIEDAEAVEDAEATAEGLTDDALTDDGLTDDGTEARTPAGAEPGRGRKGPRMWKRRPPSARSSPESPVSRNERETREIVDTFVTRFVCSRTHQLVLDSLARSRAAVADPKALAKALGVREKVVLRVLKDWRVKGLLRTVDTFPFYYDPSPKEKEAVTLFLRAWRNPAEHARLVAKILEVERG